MVELGRERVPRANWLRADVQDMPYPNGAFDAVLSSFGAVLAPRAKRTARELVRVTAPGGVVGAHGVDAAEPAGPRRESGRAA